MINYLASQPHAHLREVPLPHILHSDAGEPIYGVDEALQEARTAHHLCDLAGIPGGQGDSARIDARVAILARATKRLQRLAELHQPDRNCDGHGGNSGYCAECGCAWPCESARIAAGERDEEV